MHELPVDNRATSCYGTYMTTNELPTFQVKAFYKSEYVRRGEYVHHTDQPIFAKVTAEVATPELAVEIVAGLPKALGIKATTLDTAEGRLGYLHLHVNLEPTKGNPRNEAGIKRIRRILATLPTIWDVDRAVNAYPSQEAFEAAIA